MTIKHKKKKKHFEKDYQIENRRLNKLCQKKKKETFVIAIGEKGI